MSSVMKDRKCCEYGNCHLCRQDAKWAKAGVKDEKVKCIHPMSLIEKENK